MSCVYDGILETGCIMLGTITNSETNSFPKITIFLGHANICAAVGIKPAPLASWPATRLPWQGGHQTSHIV